MERIYAIAKERYMSANDSDIATFWIEILKILEDNYGCGYDEL